MTVKVFGIAKRTSEYTKTTEGKKYAILKIRHPKLFSEGLVTYINDKGDLQNESSLIFTFTTE
jgi:hypothetical protein